jgi:hypothetical protein
MSIFFSVAALPPSPIAAAKALALKRLRRDEPLSSAPPRKRDLRQSGIYDKRIPSFTVSPHQIMKPPG